MQFLHLQGCLCLFLHTSSIKRTMEMIYLELSFASLLLILLLLILPLFLLPFILFLLLLTYPASSLRSSSKGERLTKKEVSFPPSRNSYILFMCQKYWHQPWHNIPEQQSAVFARFHHPCVCSSEIENVETEAGFFFLFSTVFLKTLNSIANEHIISKASTFLI